MKTLSFVLVPLFFLFVLNACQQDPDWILTEEARQDSLYLSSVINLDTSLNAGADTVSSFYFYYDLQNRLVKVEENDFNVSGGVSRGVYNVFYNGNDTLPVRIGFTDGDAFSTTYFTYDGYFVTRDSVVGYDGMNNYISLGDVKMIRTGWYQRKVIIEYDTNPGVWVTMDSILFARNMSGYNLVQTIDSVWNYGNFSYAETGTFQYGQHKSPTRRFQLWYGGYYAAALPAINFCTFNNLLSEQYSSANSGNSSYTYSYIFNPGNYPVIARISNSSNKTLLTYTVR